MHWHDDLEVTGFEFADGPEHTRPLVSRELEVHLRTPDDLQGISQMPAIEGDLPALARTLASSWPTLSPI